MNSIDVLFRDDGVLLNINNQGIENSRYIGTPQEVGCSKDGEMLIGYGSMDDIKGVQEKLKSVARDLEVRYDFMSPDGVHAPHLLTNFVMNVPQGYRGSISRE